MPLRESDSTPDRDKGNSMHFRTGRTRLATAAALALLPAFTFGADMEVAGGKLAVKGSVSVGTSYRTAEQDSGLLPNVNSALVGIPGGAITASAGRNQDDGNLNFKKGDAVSQVVNAYLSAEYRSGDYGVLGSAKAWYDYALANATHPWGNFPNGYTPDARLSDEGAQTRSQFKGVALDNLYVRGHNRFDAASLDWNLGWQKLDWGNRFLVVGGLRDLNPIDIPALTRPGMLQRDQETRIPVPQIFARLGVAKSTTVEGFYQFHFERNAPNECGTLFSQLDYVSDGCNAVMIGNISDRAALAAGNYVKRADTLLASNGGQAGLGLTQTVDDWATKFGLYATQFHSRSSYYGATKSLRTTGAPYLPGDPGGLNPKYFTEYPEDIRMLAATFETKLAAATVFGELSYRPNQPLQYNSADLISAFTSPTAPTPLRAMAAAVAAGGAFHGYERHKAVQLQLGAGGQVPAVLGAAGLNWGGELVYKGVPDLPDPNVVRFGRADVFGQGPVNGVCPPPAVSTQCSMDGYVSNRAFGYRLRAGLRYANVAEGVDLLPSLLFGSDVSGWSGDGGILQGRRLAVASLRANFRGGWMAQFDWMPTWGGTYNNLRDRGTAQLFAGYQF
jgi:hypothetical protein